MFLSFYVLIGTFHSTLFTELVLVFGSKQYKASLPASIGALIVGHGIFSLLYGLLIIYFALGFASAGFESFSRYLQFFGLLNHRGIDYTFCFTVPHLLLVPFLLPPGAVHVPNRNGSSRQLPPSTHSYRGFHEYLPNMQNALSSGVQLKEADGYGAERFLRCLLLPFMEDLSGGESKRYLEENLVAKWFCGFTVSEPTLNYSLFTPVRTCIGPTRLS